MHTNRNRHKLVHFRNYTLRLRCVEEAKLESLVSKLIFGISILISFWEWQKISSTCVYTDI